MHIVFLDRDTLSPQTRLRRPTFPYTWAEHARTGPDTVAVAATGTDNIDLAGLPGAGHCGQQHPRLRQPHRARAHLRAGVCAAPQRVRLPRCGAGRALGMRVLVSGHKGRTGQGHLYTPFEDTLRQADVLTLHCPLNVHTRGMIGAAEFAQMARKPLLINTARGGLVDEHAVGPALQAGHISGAAFDVTSVEPPPADHPFMALLDRPDFILTPHVAWASEEAIQTLADQLIDNLEAFARGQPANAVVAHQSSKA